MSDDSTVLQPPANPRRADNEHDAEPPLADAAPDVEDVAPEPYIPDYISEGTAKEIEMYGFAVDPQTGLRVDESALPAGRKS